MSRGIPGGRTAGQRRDESLDDPFSEFERPWLIWDLSIGRVEDKAGSWLLVQAVRAMFFDILRRERAFPVALHVGVSIRGLGRIECVHFGHSALVEPGRLERTSGSCARRAALSEHVVG
jgi:hypothetical protein